MKLAFCSEYSDNEIVWLQIAQVPLAKTVQMQSRPTKGVLGIMLLLEQGKFPVIKTNAVTEYPLKEAVVVHEAYMRCHMSVVPTLPTEIEGASLNADHDDFPYAPGEPDGAEPFDPDHEPREEDR